MVSSGDFFQTDKLWLTLTIAPQLGNLVVSRDRGGGGNLLPSLLDKQFPSFITVANFSFLVGICMTFCTVPRSRSFLVQDAETIVTIRSPSFLVLLCIQLKETYEPHKKRHSLKPF